MGDDSAFERCRSEISEVLPDGATNRGQTYADNWSLTLTLSVLGIQYIIMQVITTKSIHIIILELMNLLHGNKFSPWEDFFVNPFSSDVISPNQLCTCTCTYIGTGSGRSTCSGTINFNRFFYPLPFPTSGLLPGETPHSPAAW